LQISHFLVYSRALFLRLKEILLGVMQVLGCTRGELFELTDSVLSCGSVVSSLVGLVRHSALELLYVLIKLAHLMLVIALLRVATLTLLLESEP